MTDQNPLPTWCTDDHWCPMEAAAAVLGRKWHPVIVYHLLEEQPLRFSELEDRMHTVSGKVLSESLEDLEEKGLVDRMVADDRPSLPGPPGSRKAPCPTPCASCLRVR